MLKSWCSNEKNTYGRQYLALTARSVCRLIGYIGLMSITPCVSAHAQSAFQGTKSSVGTKFPSHNSVLTGLTINADPGEASDLLILNGNGHQRVLNLRAGTYSTSAESGLFKTVTQNFMTGRINANLGTNHPYSAFTEFGANAQVGPNAVGTEFHGISGSLAPYASAAGDPAAWPDLIGLAGGVGIHYDWHGSHAYSVTGGTTVGPNGSVRSAIGAEMDLFIQNPHVHDRFGYNALVSGIDFAGAKNDVAYNAACARHNRNQGCWKNALYIAGGMYIDPVTSAPGGTVIGGDANLRLANVINFPNATVAGEIINTKSFRVSGAGEVLANYLRLSGVPTSRSLDSSELTLGGSSMVTTDITKCGQIPGSTGCLGIYIGKTGYRVPLFRDASMP